MKVTGIDWLFGKDGALFRAAALGSLDTASELIRKGANVNATSNRGITPLHRAAQNGHSELVELLLSKGADPAPRSADGQSPASMAAAGGHENIAAMLKARTGGR